MARSALTFPPRGEIGMRAGEVHESANEVPLSFEVSAPGLGIAEDQQSVIFQPFSQVDGSTSRNYGGSGLGLAISAQLVRQMGGHIQGESALPPRSTFRLSPPPPTTGRPTAESPPPAISHPSQTRNPPPTT